MTVSRPDPRNIIGKVPGKFCVDPTDLTAAFPHGGERLGESHEGRLILEAPKAPLTAEEYGNEVYEVIHGGEAWSIAGTLRSHDPSTYARIFLNASTGSVSGRPYVEHPGSVRAGAQLSENAVVLCFSPDDKDRHPFVVFYKAIPQTEDTVELALSLGGDEEEGFEVPYVFWATRDDSDRTMVCAPRADITL